jgi:hypothetical protein
MKLPRKLTSWASVVAVLAGFHAPVLHAQGLLDPVKIPEVFSFDDFKLRPEELEEVRSHVRHEFEANGERLAPGADLSVAVEKSIARGPRLMMSLLGSSDPTLQEMALEALAVRFGRRAASATPRVLRLVQNPAQDERTAQLAVRTLIKIAIPDRSLAATLAGELQKTPAARLELKCALVDAIGSMGPVASEHRAVLESELAAPSGRLQFKAVQALANIAPSSSVGLERLQERHLLQTGAPGMLLRSLDQVHEGDVVGRKAAAAWVASCGATTPRHRKCLALEAAHRAGLRDRAVLGLALDALKDDDEYVNAYGTRVLSKIDKAAATESVAMLADSLASPSSVVRMAVAETLGRLGPAAAPATAGLAKALVASNSRTPEPEIGLYLETLKAIGPGARSSAETLVSLLPEDSAMLRDRPKLRVYHIRGFIMVTLAAVGVPDSALPFILETLANTPKNMPYPYAAAARAAAGLGTKARVTVPYLLRALNGELTDDFLTFERLTYHRSGTGEYTSCMIETIRALARIGPEARAAVPLLESLTRRTAIPTDGQERLYRRPSVPEEAIKALKAIQT